MSEETLIRLATYAMNRFGSLADSHLLDARALRAEANKEADYIRRQLVALTGKEPE